MSDDDKFKVAADRAKRLIKARIVTAKARSPHCCLCRKRIEKGEKYHRLSGGLCGHTHCAKNLVRTDTVEVA